MLMPALLLASLLCVPAPAGGASSPTAERLVRSVLPPERHAEIVEEMTAQALASLQQQGARPAADAQQRLRAAIAESVPYEELVAITARIYASHFTDRELQDLLAFYKTHTGAKLTRELPAIMGDSMRETGRIVQSRLPALLEKNGLVQKRNPQDAPARSGASDSSKKQ